MAKARVLKFDEAVRWNRKVIWMEMRETPGMFPVTYYAEHLPFLRFDCEDRVLMIEVRAEMYGQTWRCWDQRPDGQPVPDWKDPDDRPAGAKARTGTAGKKSGK